MPDLGPLVPALAIALLALVLIWFALGTQLNVRRGNRVLAWLQEGLPALGPRATLRWLGSSVAALSIVQPAAPYLGARPPPRAAGRHHPAPESPPRTAFWSRSRLSTGVESWWHAFE